MARSANNPFFVVPADQPVGSQSGSDSTLPLTPEPLPVYLREANSISNAKWNGHNSEGHTYRIPNWCNDVFDEVLATGKLRSFGITRKTQLFADAAIHEAAFLMTTFGFWLPATHYDDIDDKLQHRSKNVEVQERAINTFLTAAMNAIEKELWFEFDQVMEEAHVMEVRMNDDFRPKMQKAMTEMEELYHTVCQRRTTRRLDD